MTKESTCWARSNLVKAFNERLLTEAVKKQDRHLPLNFIPAKSLPRPIPDFRQADNITLFLRCHVGRPAVKMNRTSNFAYKLAVFRQDY